MRRLRVVMGLGAVLALAVPGVAHAAATGFQARLAGKHEIPNVVTPAKGVAVFRFHTGSQELEYVVVAGNLEGATAAHIHLGGIKQEGNVVIALTEVFDDGSTVVWAGRADGDDLVGPIGSMRELYDAMVARRTYVNAHTVDFPGGEIRGQIVLAD